jgi:hypothetical protein
MISYSYDVMRLLFGGQFSPVHCAEWPYQLTECSGVQ